MKLTTLFEEIPMKLDPALTVDKYQQKKAANPGRPEAAPDNPANKLQPRYPGNPFTASKERHRKFFNMGPNSAAPEQKLSNGETSDSQSRRPIMNNAGDPDRSKAAVHDLLGLKK